MYKYVTKEDIVVVHGIAFVELEYEDSAFCCGVGEVGNFGYNGPDKVTPKDKEKIYAALDEMVREIAKREKYGAIQFADSRENAKNKPISLLEYGRHYSGAFASKPFKNPYHQGKTTVETFELII